MKVCMIPYKDPRLIGNKYSITTSYKKSTFASIYIGQNVKNNKVVCIKKIKDDKAYFDQSLMEIFILDYLKKSGNPNKYNFLEMYEYFYLNRHLFIITEKLGLSLYD